MTTWLGVIAGRVVIRRFFGVRVFFILGVGGNLANQDVRKSAEMFSDRSKVRGTEQAERNSTIQIKERNSSPRNFGLLATVFCDMEVVVVGTPILYFAIMLQNARVSCHSYAMSIFRRPVY